MQTPSRQRSVDAARARLSNTASEEPENASVGERGVAAEGKWSFCPHDAVVHAARCGAVPVERLVPGA